MRAAFDAQMFSMQQQLAVAREEKEQAQKEKEVAVALTKMSWPLPAEAVAKSPPAVGVVSPGNLHGGGKDGSIGASPIITTTVEVVEDAEEEMVDETHLSSASDPLIGAQGGLAKMPAAVPQNGMGQEGEAAVGSDHMPG